MLSALTPTWNGLLAALEHWPGFVLLAALWAATAGRLGKGLGLGNLFADDACLLDPDTGPGTVAILRASPAFWSLVGVPLLFGVVWATAYETPGCAPCLWPLGEDAGPARAAAALRLMVGAGVAGLLFMGAGWMAARAIRPDGSQAAPAAIRRETIRRLFGLALGLGLLFGIWRAAGALPGGIHEALPFGLSERWSSALLWFYAFALGALAVALLPARIPPCVSLMALLAGLVLVGGALERFGEGWDEIAALIALGWIVYANGRLYKLRIPGFSDALYADPVNPNAPSDPAAPQAAAASPDRIDPVEALDAWAARLRAEKGPAHRPKLALLCTSGGAYRASFWTALLLDALRARSAPEGALPGLIDNLRLITGASGGMVGGAYFAAMAAEGDDGSVLERLERDIRAFQTEGAYRRGVAIPRDSLTPVAQRMVRGDLPRVFLPGRPPTDRGIALERQWRTLDRAFSEIAEAERDGRAPSIVFSPMLVESGAPAFLTNLDLAELRARSLGMEDDRSAIDRESVEIFAAFPDARAAVTLATATRLNATFPFVSPAVSLPTRPTRRVVDAGYYDNYGVDLAAAFLQTWRVREWILENCSGVAVLQFRAFPSDRADAPKGPAARAFQWLTSPVEGVFRARSATQMFRNNQQLREAITALDIEAGGRSGARAFAESFAFEAAADASMSWYLPADELNAMAQLLPDPPARAPAPEAGVAAAGAAAETLRARATRQGRKLAAEFARLEAFWNAP